MINRSLTAIVALLALQAGAGTVREAAEPLIAASCIDCHDASTKTRLNFSELGHNLTDHETFKTWERIYDRVESGEMPPASEPRPDASVKASTLNVLRDQLTAESQRRQREVGRVSTRRLTRLEYEHTLHDLFAIQCDLSSLLPPENDAARFDTIADSQGLSPVHIRSYLAAADQALDEAIQLRGEPVFKQFPLDYANSKYMQLWFERDLSSGGQTVRRDDDEFVMFDFRSYVTRSDANGVPLVFPGTYKISGVARGYQAKTNTTLGVYRANEGKGFTRLIAAFDLAPGESRPFEIATYFGPGDFFHVAALEVDPDARGRNIFAAGGQKFYKGEGVAIGALNIVGPWAQQWPPESTRCVLPNAQFERVGYGRFGHHRPVVEGTPREYITSVVRTLGPRILRRPLTEAEVERFASLADDAIEAGEPIQESVRGPVKAMLSSPMFLFHSGESGTLDDFALATRLSYFLWKTCPDDELYELASDGRLHEPQVLTAQVNRLLDDPRSERFVHDFLDQWVGLRNIDATTPDDQLYPEYDDLLRQAMLAESRLFFQELVREDLSVANLIDADFTFLNRRLAEHYGIDGIEGETMRRVALPGNHIRGGLMTQASVLKVTANGTTTTPVKRGNFVLASLLGTPPSPPPPSVGSIEPDTRGATTIRGLLDKHRNTEACAACHREIDPPGFALESFDPIGQFREHYRANGDVNYIAKLFGQTKFGFKQGPPVDPSGMTSDGVVFDDIHGFRKYLLTRTDDVARNLAEQLVVYATGAEIQFADRDVVDRLVNDLADNQYPVRSMIHGIVQSDLFRNK